MTRNGTNVHYLRNFFWKCLSHFSHAVITLGEPVGNRTQGKRSSNGQVGPRHTIPHDDFDSGEVEQQNDGPQKDDVHHSDQRKEEGDLAVGRLTKDPLERHLRSNI